MNIMLLRAAVKYWREFAIAALILTVVATCAARDHRLEAGAVARDRSRAADAVIATVAPARIRAETLVVHDTVRVRVAIDRLVTLRDTLLEHLTDTVLVREYVTRADSVARACTELSNDCAAFRAYATQEIAAWKTKAAAAPIAAERSCVVPSLVSGGLAALGGYFVAAHARR